MALEAYGGGDEASPTSDGTAVDPQHPLPFEEAFTPFLALARSRFELEAGAAADALMPAARLAIERQLTSNLAFVANQTLGYDFYDYRFSQAPMAAFESAWREHSPTQEIYRSYVSDMRAGRLLDLMDHYPVLARLLSQVVDQWAQSTAAFCQHFCSDFPLLQTTHGWHVDRTKQVIADVHANLSDRHRGGHTVLELTLHSGERIIYKPRSLGPEVVFGSVLDWLNQTGDLSLSLMVPLVTDRAEYGWMEFVQPLPCTSKPGVHRFYRRAGMLLAVLHVLAITDIHRDNLIANGEHPVVVDTETMLSSPPPGVRPSVIHTGMLPQWQRSADGHRFDVSALCSEADHDFSGRPLSWSSPNSDQMMLQEDVTPGSTDHRVKIGERFPTLREHLGDFLGGFDEAYRTFQVRRKELLSSDSLHRSLDELDVRILLRNTNTYAQLQLHSLRPEYLRSGLDRSIELDWLARPLSARQPHPGRASVCEAERLALEALDVPRFTKTSGELDGIAEDREFSGLFGLHRGAQTFVQRLEELSASDLEKHVDAVNKCVQERFGGSTHGPNGEVRTVD